MIIRTLKHGRKKNFIYYFKLIIKSCLVSVFIILLSVFAIMGICYVDSVYNESQGLSKSPLLSKYVVVTESMVPTISVNDAIVVGRVNYSNVDIGDIITFSSGDSNYNGLTITHRVVGKQLSSDGYYLYRTKGDNNILEDAALVEFDCIYGKVLFKIPKIGYIKKMVSTPLGFILSISIPVLIIVFYETYRVAKVIKQKDLEIEII